MCTAVSNYRKPTGNRAPCKTNTRPNCPTKSCVLCKQADHPDNAHFLSECSFLPEQDRKYIAKPRQITDIFDDPSEPETRPCEDESISETDDTGSSPSSYVFCIQTRQSPYCLGNVLRKPPSSCNHRQWRHSKHDLSHRRLTSWQPGDTQFPICPPNRWPISPAPCW